MKFRAEEYYQASTERMRQARILYDGGEDFALAMYCAGLAVECLLRAFRWTEDATFEGRHDLAELLKASRLLRVDEEHMRRRGLAQEEILEAGQALRAAVNEVVAVWHNNLRFASEDSLKAYLKRIGRLQRVRGNPLKGNARELIVAAQTVINRGVTLWVSRKR
jgi:hypothetical protein